MICVRTATPEFLPDIGDMLRLFLGDVQIAAVEGEAAYEHSVLEECGFVSDRWSHGDAEYTLRRPAPEGSPIEIKRERKRQVKTALYMLLKQITGMQPPWGSLTGIRPTRLLYEALDEGMDLEGAKAHVMREFDVSADRA